MKIIITQWALDAYLNLKHKRVFSNLEYMNVIRPDVMRLKNYPNDPKFGNNKFWSLVKFKNQIIKDGFKMKWHQIGSGNAQLRLPLGLVDDAYLCETYVKRDEKYEKRVLARFDVHLQLIKENNYTERGRLL